MSLKRPIRHAILIALLITVAGIATAAVSGTVAAQSETDIQWDEGSAGANAPPTTEDIKLEPVSNSITFGADTGRSLRIQDVDTGESITITPTGSTYEVTEFELNFNAFVYIDDGEYQKADEFEMELDHEQGDISDYPVEVSGDPTTFYEETFSEYRVQLVGSDGTVLSETEETKIKGAGYKESYRYDGSTVALERDPGVQPDWYVVLEQYDAETETTYTYTGDYGQNDEYITFELDSNFDPNKDFDVAMYPDEAQKNNLEDRIINLFGVELANPEEESNLEIVDGSIGDDTSDPNQDESDDSGSDESDDGADQNPDESDEDGSTEDGSSSADISISSRPTSVVPGDSATVRFSVTNTGENASAGGIQFDTPAGITAENVFFTGGIDSGETITRVVSIGTNENMQTDTYTITADATVGTRTDTASFDLTVGEDDGLSRFDQTGSGTIDFTDVIAAIEANNRGTEIGGQPVSFTDVINVIEANNQGTAV